MSTTPPKGRADYLELGDWNAQCSMCNRKMKASMMVKNWQGMYRCPEHNEPRQPQDFVRAVPDIMSVPWSQPPPSDSGFFAMPTVNIDENTSSQTVSINTGSSLAGGVTLVITIGSGVNIALLVLDDTTSTASDVIYADEVIINNNGELGVVLNADAIDLTIRNFGGGGYASSLAFTVQPSDTGVNAVMAPSVEVSLVDADGEVIEDFTSDVVLSLDTNPGGASLGGTLTQAAVAGVAVFDDLDLDKLGAGYTLLATAPDSVTDVDRVSAAFNATGQLVFTTQPSSTAFNTVISPSIVVTIQDGLGATITSYTDNITIGFAAGGNPGGATLGGTLTRAAVAGVATFNNITVSVEADDYRLEANASTVSDDILSVESNTFDISGYILTSAQVGDSIGFISGTMGSVAPTTFLGQTVTALYTNFPGASNGGIFTLDNASLPQDFFTSITVGGVTKLTADATYGSGTWTWTGASLITAEGALTVSFV